MSVSREAVKRQLAELGYHDCPEDVVDEFLAELQAELNRARKSAAPPAEILAPKQKKPARVVQERPVNVPKNKSVARKPANQAHAKSTSADQELVSEALETMSERERRLEGASADPERMDHGEYLSSDDQESEESFEEPAWPRYSNHRGDGSMSARGVIITQNSQRRKADPVSRFHQYQSTWKSDRYLKSRGKKDRVVVSKGESSKGERPQSANNSVKSGPNRYEVPTEKRRDNLRWEVKMRMLEIARSGVGTSPRSLPLQQNSYVCPTSKRRDNLRWQVRGMMAEAPQ